MARAKKRTPAKRPVARKPVKPKRGPAAAPKPAREPPRPPGPGAGRAAAKAASKPRAARRGSGGRRAPANVRRRAGRAAPPLPMPAVLLEARPVADVVAVPARTALAIDGAGGPEEPAFGRAVGAIHGVAHTLKFARRAAGKDFRIGPLEGRWWAEGAPPGGGVPPRDAWRWRLRLAVPDDVDEHELADVIQAATMKKGGRLEGSAEARRVQVERIPAATMGRVLHVGPYAEEERSLESLRAAVAAAGRAPALAHLEIHLSDPRRTRPEKRRTGLLLELAP